MIPIYERYGLRSSLSKNYHNKNAPPPNSTTPTKIKLNMLKNMKNVMNAPVPRTSSNDPVTNAKNPPNNRIGGPKKITSIGVNIIKKIQNIMKANGPNNADSILPPITTTTMKKNNPPNTNIEKSASAMNANIKNMNVIKVAVPMNNPNATHTPRNSHTPPKITVKNITVLGIIFHINSSGNCNNHKGQSPRFKNSLSHGKKTKLNGK